MSSPSRYLCDGLAARACSHHPKHPFPARRPSVLGGADADAVNKISQTPLIYAVVEGNLEVAEAILEHGRPDLTVGNKLHWDWAPMHWAAMQVF